MGSIMSSRSGAWGERSEAWESLSGRLGRLARALCGAGREAEAADLTQTTLARLLARIGATGEPPPYHYARSAMVHAFLDERRSTKRRVARTARWALGRAGVARERGVGERDETRRALEAALARLSGLQRAAITLRLVEELSYEAIGEALDTTPERVRSALHAARGRMRAALGAEWRDE